MRHRDAFPVAREPAAATGFGGLAGHHQALLVTYRRSGEPARIVASAEEEHAYAILKANYRLDHRLLESTLDLMPIGIAYVVRA